MFEDYNDALHHEECQCLEYMLRAKLSEKSKNKQQVEFDTK